MPGERPMEPFTQASGSPVGRIEMGIDFSDLPEEQSTNGQIKKAHRLIRLLWRQIYEQQRKIERLALNHPYPEDEES